MPRARVDGRLPTMPMLIVNADDFGRSREETDIIVSCYMAGRISSATAMVFMEASSRAADSARETGIDLGPPEPDAALLGRRRAVALARVPRADRQVPDVHEDALLMYNPSLRGQFQYVYQAQFDEFVRMYGRQPSHIDGHQHKHLCTNMLVDRIIPAQQKVRRSFSFWPGEKGSVNRAYRAVIDRFLMRRHRVTDFFFSLQQCLDHDQQARAFGLSQRSLVELMTHPVNPRESAYLMSDADPRALGQLEMGTYQSV